MRGNTPIGQSAYDIPRGMSTLLGCCRSNHFLDYNSSHLPREGCGATRTEDASRPASAISSRCEAMSGRIWSVSPDRPQATAPATNHESPVEEDVAYAAAPAGFPGAGCQVRTIVRCRLCTSENQNQVADGCALWRNVLHDHRALRWNGNPTMITIKVPERQLGWASASSTDHVHTGISHADLR